MQIDPAYQAPRSAWDSPASSPGTCRRSFRILERLRRRRPSQASTPRLLLCFSPRRPPTCRPVSSLGRAGARRPLPLCFSLRRRPFASCQSPARTQVAGAVFSATAPRHRRACGQEKVRCVEMPRHRRWCKDAAGAEHHRDDSADIQIGMPFR